MRSTSLALTVAAVTVFMSNVFATPAAASAMPLPVERASQPEWKLPKKCKNKQAKILYKAGFNKPGMLRGAWAITWRESNHNALDESSPWYTGALGTWQIQTSAWSGRPWWSRSAMLDKYAQSKIVRKYFLRNGMHNWGYGYSFKKDTWYEDAGMYYSLWGSSTTYAWVIKPFNDAWAAFPKACRD